MFYKIASLSLAVLSWRTKTRSIQALVLLAAEAGLSHRPYKPTLLCCWNGPIRNGLHKGLVTAYLGCFTVATLRRSNDRITLDKPPQFTTVVSQAFLSVCQLQRANITVNCIETLDLQFAVGGGAASFVCLLLTNSHWSWAFRLS